MVASIPGGLEWQEHDDRGMTVGVLKTDVSGGCGYGAFTLTGLFSMGNSE